MNDGLATHDRITAMVSEAESVAEPGEPQTHPDETASKPVMTVIAPEPPVVSEPSAAPVPVEAVTPPPADAVPPEHATPTARSAAPAAAVIPARRGGRFFVAVCTLVTLAAACAALAAPWLRPRLDAEARQWFGDGNVISQLLAQEIVAAPEPATPPPIAAPVPPPPMAAEPPRETDTATLERLAADEQTILTLSGALQAMQGDIARLATSLAAPLDGLSQRADRLQAATSVLEARARAGSILALTIGLRRDVDAGVPIGRTRTALRAVGGYPASVDAALSQLERLDSGIPTMRDLAEAFEAVQARLATRADGTSFGRAWTRVKSVLGVGTPSNDDVLVQHLRALVADGRFTEAAHALEASEWAPLGSDWVAMIRARATGVIAAQIILTYALTGVEAAYTGPSTGTEPGKATP